MQFPVEHRCDLVSLLSASALLNFSFVVIVVFVFPPFLKYLPFLI